jgi:hypothetical protein
MYHSPEIPGELLVKMFIHKAEKEALWIDYNATEIYRRDNQIPDSDRFAMIMPRDKRQHPPIYLISMKQIIPDIQVYQRLYWGNYLYIFHNSNLEEEHKF